MATFGQREVQVLVGFTPDRSQVERAITTLGVTESQPPARDPLNIAYDLGGRRWGPGIGPPPGDDMSQNLIEMARLMARGEPIGVSFRAAWGGGPTAAEGAFLWGGMGGAS